MRRTPERDARARIAQMRQTLRATAAELPVGPSLGLRAAAALLSLLACCLLAFSVLCSHSQILPSRGIYLSASPMLSIKAPVAGVVVATHVRAGDPVSAGSPLFTIARTSGDQGRGAEPTRVTVHAPVKGSVADLLALRGSHVLPDQQTVVTLQSTLTGTAAMPAAAQLVAYVGSADMGAIAAERGARVWFDAYPSDHYGTFAARVLSISKTTIDVRHALLRLPEKQPYYQVTLALAATPRGPAHRRLALIDGMSVTVDFVGERRTVLEWLLAPLHRIRKRLFDGGNA